MGRTKTADSSNSPTKETQSTEEDSASEEIDIASETMEETVDTKSEEVEVEVRTSGEEAQETETEEIPGTEIEDTPGKRGRGRPRKYPATKRPAETDGEDIVKKKRGRPRKFPLENGMEAPRRKSKKKSQPSVYLDTFDEEGYPHKRPGRGRPRKEPQVVITTNDDTGTYEVDYLEWYADDGLTNEPVMTKKRGRPKKMDSPNGTSSKRSKSGRRSTPRILLKGYENEPFSKKKRRGRGRPRKDDVGGSGRSRGVGISHKTEARFGSQIDRLSSLVDRLENRINLDGLIDEDTDIESEQEIDKQIFLLQRNFNVNLDLKNEFKEIVKSYMEDLGAIHGCLIATVRSYKGSGRIVLFEIWESEAEQSEFFKESVSRIWDKETSEMLQNSTVVKNMNIPARWWQRTR